MCLILFAYERHPRYRLVMAANRDEFYRRPTLPMAFWGTRPDILGGRDLRGGGTWMGVTRGGRVAAVTNYRDPAAVREGAPTRGALVRGFLAGEDPPADYLEKLAAGADRYNGFNLVVSDGETMAYFGNRSSGVRTLEPGIYGLSNHLLNTPWPKVERGRRALSRLLDDSGEDPVDPERLMTLLSDRTRPDDSRLPDTGVGRDRERLLAPIFIAGGDYGTRSSSVVLWERSGCIEVWERTFERGRRPAAGGTRRFLVDPEQRRRPGGRPPCDAPAGMDADR